MWEQNACGQPVCGVQQVCGVLPECGCDACAPLMTGGLYADGWPSNGEFYAMGDQGTTECGCGQQHFTDGSMYFPDGNGPYEYSVEAPMMSVPSTIQGNSVPRAFPPTHPYEAPRAPDTFNDGVAKPIPMPPADDSPARIPQDMTPMNPPMEFPKNAPGEFDPLQEEGAPAADSVVDPVSFEIPRLPPLPERAHSSVKRGGPHQIELIPTDAEQFQW